MNRLCFTHSKVWGKQLELQCLRAELELDLQNPMLVRHGHIPHQLHCTALFNSHARETLPPFIKLDNVLKTQIMCLYMNSDFLLIPFFM